MLDVPVYSNEGLQVGKVAVDEAHLGGRVRPVLLKQVIVMYQANKRQGSSGTKSRGMVRGSTRKLYRQKGTGNARVGSARTPQRRGGGRAFPKCQRDYRKRMPKRMRRLACRNAVLAKLLSDDVVILDSLSMDQPRTGQLQSVLRAVGVDRSCVLALSEIDPIILKSGRNLPRTDVTVVSDLNAYGVLRRKKLVFTKAAFEVLSAKAAREYSE